MKEITVYKLDENGRVVRQYPATVVERLPNLVRLEAFFNQDDLVLDYTTFRRGDRFIETFYTDRWYNVFAIFDRDSQALKGWYCNICRPASIGESSITCEDLALDVWVEPGGQITVLDEDEFAALPLVESDRKQSLIALRQLQQLAQKGCLPP